MKLKRKWMFNTAILIVASISQLFAQIMYPVKVGDRAPSLGPVEWVVGDSVSNYNEGCVYVVEFSATWCAPCRKAIPHLNQIALKYSSAISVISLYANEKEDKTDVSYFKKVNAFFDQMKYKIGFRVGAIDPGLQFARAWNVVSIPSIFVVDASGYIAWIGSDPSDLDLILDRILKKRFDARETMIEQEQFDKCLGEIIKLKGSGFFLAALSEVDSLLKLYPDRNYLYRLKFEVLAGDDDFQANEWLKLMLDSELKDFDWDHFVPETWDLPKLPNYNLALRVADKAIEEAENDLVVAHLLIQKANIYHAMGNRLLAIKVCKQALEHSRSSGNPNDYKSFERDLEYFKDSLKN